MCFIAFFDAATSGSRLRLSMTGASVPKLRSCIQTSGECGKKIVSFETVVSYMSRITSLTRILIALGNFCPLVWNYTFRIKHRCIFSRQIRLYLAMITVSASATPVWLHLILSRMDFRFSTYRLGMDCWKSSTSGRRIHIRYTDSPFHFCMCWMSSGQSSSRKTSRSIMYIPRDGVRVACTVHKFTAASKLNMQLIFENNNE